MMNTQKKIRVGFIVLMGVLLISPIAGIAGMCGMGGMDMDQEKSGSAAQSHQGHGQSSPTGSYSQYSQDENRYLQTLRDSANALRTSNPSLANQLDVMIQDIMRRQSAGMSKTQGLTINQGEGSPDLQGYQGHSQH